MSFDDYGFLSCPDTRPAIEVAFVNDFEVQICIAT